MIQKIIQKILPQNFEQKMHSFSLPGFDGIPLLDVITMFRAEVKRDALGVRASSISFFFILAMFPSIIFFFSLIPYIPVPNVDRVIFDYLQKVLPTPVYFVLQSTISDIISIQRGGLTSFNFILALVFSLNGVTSMMQVFDKINLIHKKRNFWAKRWAAFKITILMSIQLIVAMALIVIGEQYIRDILYSIGIESKFTVTIIMILKFLTLVFIFLNTIALIYFYGPSVKERYKFYSPGATFATILMLLLSYVLKWYFAYFHNFNKLYGSLGIVLVVMLWVYFNAFVLLFGYEVNNSIALNKKLKSIPMEEDF
jgi:membrane protein